MSQIQVRGFTLLHKALALVFIPFVFNCVWLFMLFDVMNKAQHLAELERQQSRFVEGLNSVLRGSYQTRENFVGYIATDSRKYLARADVWIDKTQQALLSIKSLPALTREQMTLTNELEAIIVDQSKLIRDVFQHSSGDSKKGLLEDIQPVSEGVDSVLNKYPNTEEHVTKQRKGLELARSEAAENSASAQKILLIGTIGNLFLTLFLVFGIRRDLANRLNRLMENTKKLPRSQPLNAQISGGDELAALDQSLHDAAAELRKHAEFRASLMQMVAHDLRSPLTSCLVGVEVLSSSSAARQELERIDAIKTSLTRVIDLTNDLLLIEQFESSQLPLSLDSENMQDLVEQAYSSVSGSAAAKNLKFIIDVGNAYLLVDRKRILQVLVNFFCNAIKFSPQDSSITVSSLREAQELKILIKDNGPGVPLSEQEKVFERFFQSKEGRQVGGIGLGLAIAKMIVEAHGGTVGVLSEPAAGAAFWFTIPMPSEQSDAAS